MIVFIRQPHSRSILSKIIKFDCVKNNSSRRLKVERALITVRLISNMIVARICLIDTRHGLFKPTAPYSRKGRAAVALVYDKRRAGHDAIVLGQRKEKPVIFGHNLWSRTWANKYRDHLLGGSGFHKDPRARDTYGPTTVNLAVHVN